MSIEFLEIEHKYIVDAGFNVADFSNLLQSLGATESYSVSVRDSYFLVDSIPNRIFRHRFDNLLQQLTVKDRSSNIESRLEINLTLDSADQNANVQAFLSTFGKLQTFYIHKKVEVFHFPDCEIVYYKASNSQKTVFCVEFEAINQKNVPDALKVIEKYEKATGFFEKQRSSSSLFDLLCVNLSNKV